MSNKKGWYVNYSTNGVPTNSFGPFDQPVTLVEALNYVASMIALNQ